MTLLVLSLALLSQFKTIHQIELERHPDAYVDKVERANPPLPLVKGAQKLRRTVYGFLPYWQRSQAGLIRWNLISHLAAFGVEVNWAGDITNYHGWPGLWADIVDSAHANGVQVHIVAICFNSDDIHTLITTPSYTQNFISNMLQLVSESGIEGMNVDFEIPYSSDRDNLTNFMRTVADSFHAHGFEVTMDLMAVDDAWSDRYDQAALAGFLDGLMIMAYDYFYSGSDHAGPVSPLTGYTYNFTRSLNDYVNTTGRPEKIIMGVPYYGYDWPTVDSTRGARTVGRGSAVFYSSAASNAALYGRIWDDYSQTPWYRYTSSGQWHQCWYDDDSSLALKYEVVNDADIQGIGIWALTYDGTRSELWDALLEAFGDTLPQPSKVEGLMVEAIGSNRIRVSWYPAENAVNYEVYVSEDGVNFELRTTTSNTTAIISNLTEGGVYYFKVRGTNPWWTGEFSDVLAGVATRRSLPTVLVVDGFDEDVEGNTHDFIRFYAPFLAERGIVFNSVSDEAVRDSQVVLPWYMAVVWILGTEGDSLQAFTQSEREQISAFLSFGRSLLISGSNIASSLAQSDSAFLCDVLGAYFVTDDVEGDRAIVPVNSIFASLDTLHFDDGTHGSYDVADPDGIKPSDSSTYAFQFVGVDTAVSGAAGIVKETPFSKIVLLTVPIETIYDDSERGALIHAIFDWFGIGSDVAEPPSEGLLVNRSIIKKLVPMHSRKLLVQATDETDIDLGVFDVSGRLIYRGLIKNGRSITIELPHSGVFIVRAAAGSSVEKRKVVILDGLR